MALGDEPSLVNHGQTKDITNGVVRRKRGRPRKHPLPDPAGTSKVAKTTGARDNGKATVPTTNTKQQAGGSGPDETLLHQTCTDELLESLLEESPTIPLNTRVEGNKVKNYNLNEQQISLTTSNGPRNGLQPMQRDTYGDFSPKTNGDLLLQRGEETGRESQHCIRGQNEPRRFGKGAARLEKVDFISNLQQYRKQILCQGDIISGQVLNNNESSRHPVESGSSKLAAAVNHLKMMLWQVRASNCTTS